MGVSISISATKSRDRPLVVKPRTDVRPHARFAVFKNPPSVNHAYTPTKRRPKRRRVFPLRSEIDCLPDLAMRTGLPGERAQAGDPIQRQRLQANGHPASLPSSRPDTTVTATIGNPCLGTYRPQRDRDNVLTASAIQCLCFSKAQRTFRLCIRR
ncbi:hypothetical protein HU200_012477 [Digitaria exilis]|uniref:Uncharacterized protein n=1 Tax=Digitaria exilis TaxID=1010633 RepID=A0A835FEQ4_9POAL|nr:hypothetical protein HU200_012477 [Digitaria exilis]